ncbi:putative secreted protein [Rhodopirellula maiorica SM1]|uniref:Putative secreted protein n=1 Tax=Rhodopirellula maiorica SM1 TaxID=1265738 RepID=M5RRC1_9BACT|nr:DUF6655 family protein [Rhodopirellula maiorica]EMI17932.1 putative secreted protein [Rhodopirellula maiorica SM1]
MRLFPSHANCRFINGLAWMVLAAAVTGCGTTQEQLATQQLVLSKAIDRSVAGIDFRPLSGRKVYLDTSYLRQAKDVGFVNADYVTSSLRQQIAAAGCLLQDTNKDADIVVEARIGTLGADEHRVTFGIPENNGLASAASMLPNAPSFPAMPEFSLARRDSREGAAKIAAFAYERDSRQVVWQSGIRESNATARDTYVFGIGPFQSGSIRERTKLAGSKYLKFGGAVHNDSPHQNFARPPVNYTAETRFQDGWPVFDSSGAFLDFIEGPADDTAEEPTAIAAQPPEPPDDQEPATETR